MKLLPGHSDYAKQTAREFEEKELEKAYLMANRHKRKRLHAAYDYIKTRFPDPRDRSAYTGYKHKRPKARTDVNELIYYKNHKVYYSRTMRKYMGFKNVWTIMAADTRPILVTDYDSKTDVTNEFYAKLLMPKVESYLKTLDADKLRALLTAEVDFSDVIAKASNGK